MNFFTKLLSVIFVSNFIFLVPFALSDSTELIITTIQYTEKDLTELSEIPVYAAKNKVYDQQFQLKVDELIDLLEAQKNAAEKGHDIDRLQEKVIEINSLIEDKKEQLTNMSITEFHQTLCFKCHSVADFSPSDKTQKQWRRLIEDDGHAIFENISWETPYQKNQILEFLLENAGNYRAEGIGVWN